MQNSTPATEQAIGTTNRNLIASDSSWRAFDIGSSTSNQQSYRNKVGLSRKFGQKPKVFEMQAETLHVTSTPSESLQHSQVFTMSNNENFQLFVSKEEDRRPNYIDYTFKK